MVSKRMMDLRFVIGLFFFIIAVILLGAHFFGPSDEVQGIHLNLATGLVMLGFGSIMMASTFFDASLNKINPDLKGMPNAEI